MSDDYVLKHTDGRYYSFAGGDNYDGPQFSRDPRDAKRMTLRGARNVQGRLANPKWHGEHLEIMHAAAAE